jgi:hypothetical protein
MVAYLEAFVRVLPFLKTQDPPSFPEISTKISVAAKAVNAGDPPPSTCTLERLIAEAAWPSSMTTH